MIATPARVRTSSPLAAGRGEVWVLTASAIAEAAAGAILLGGGAALPGVALLAAIGVHAAAVLLALGPTRTPTSRRWLSLAAALCVPLVGTAVAIAATLTTGRGRALRRRRTSCRRPAVALAEAHRVRDALPLWDALAGDDHEQRRAALLALSRRDDAEAIALLRRTATAVDPDQALSAALALDEISERVERRTRVRNEWSVRDAVG